MLHRVCLIVFLIYLCGCHPVKGTVTEAVRKDHENVLFDSSISFQRQLLKDYALCTCIINGYKADSAIQNDISISFYHEQTLYSEDALLKIDSISKSQANSIVPSKYPDYKGKRAVIYFCTEYFKSSRLDSIVKSMDHSIMN